MRSEAIYTLAITSCGRHDLLEETLVSFYTHVSVLPEQTLIYEDGPSTRPQWVPREVVWIQGGIRRGQIHAVDELYRHVKTDLIFHCEDDWKFMLGGRWIEDSKWILEFDPEIIYVSLRGQMWNHPLTRAKDGPYFIAQENWRGGWGGFAFNPGLRRRSDWERIGSYGAHVKHGPYAKHEQELSIMYGKMGYKIADLGLPIIRHLGEGRSVLDEFVTKNSASS